jgi:GxxExxY protein
MAIEVATQIRVFDQEQFHAVDKRVMAIVFDLHNEFGRLLDENLYKNALVLRCAQSGIEPAEREVAIRVTHGTFLKDYSMDLLFARGMMLEAKTAETITRGHRAQSLNYLFVAGMKHGRLVNLRPERVEHEFVSTTLDPAQRKQFVVADTEWREPNAPCAALKTKLIELLRDWGAFLEVRLYRDALVHFLNGSPASPTDVEIRDGPNLLGRQPMHLLAKDTALSCTAITRGIEQMGEHQRRMLAHTALRYVQWENMNHARIELRTPTAR